MQHPPPTPPSTSPCPRAAPPTGAADALEGPDIVSLLILMGHLGPLRNDPRAWRLRVLDALLELLHASAAVAFALRHVAAETPPIVVSLFEAGAASANATGDEDLREAIHREFNAAAFHDPLGRRTIDRFVADNHETFSAARADLVPDDLWYSDPHVQLYRLNPRADDCMLSLQRGGARGTAYALYVFRPTQPAAGVPARFSARDRTLLHLLHQGLQMFYRVDEANHHIRPDSLLRPRLRQTLECLLLGDTERQVAMKMSLSVHTVHDYVKAIYQHFGVSSRAELLSKWIQTSGQEPAKHPPA